MNKKKEATIKIDFDNLNIFWSAIFIVGQQCLRFPRMCVVVTRVLCRLPLTAAHSFIFISIRLPQNQTSSSSRKQMRGLYGRQRQPAVTSPIRDVTRQLPLRLFRRFKQLFSILTPYGESHVISGARFLWQNFPISLYTATSRCSICILHRFAHDRDGPAGLLIGRESSLNDSWRVLHHK
jgi:hypothetical protein